MLFHEHRDKYVFPFLLRMQASKYFFYLFFGQKSGTLSNSTANVLLGTLFAERKTQQTTNFYF